MEKRSKKRKSHWLWAALAAAVIIFSLFAFLPKPKYILMSFDADAVDSKDAFITILSILEENDVKATFFVTGQFAEQNPTIINYLDEHNYEIGCHTYDNNILTKMSDDEKDMTISRCISAISKIIGRDPEGFRAQDHEIDAKTFSLLKQYGFSYDASLVSGYESFSAEPTVPEIKLSSFIFLPIEDYIYMANLNMPDTFFWLSKMVRANHISIVMHPRFISGYPRDLENLIQYYKGYGAKFISYKEFLNIGQQL